MGQIARGPSQREAGVGRERIAREGHGRDNPNSVHGVESNSTGRKKKQPTKP